MEKSYVFTSNRKVGVDVAPDYPKKKSGDENSENLVFSIVSSTIVSLNNLKTIIVVAELNLNCYSCIAGS